MALVAQRKSVHFDINIECEWNNGRCECLRIKSFHKRESIDWEDYRIATNDDTECNRLLNQPTSIKSGKTMCRQMTMIKRFGST